jgi:hypothetical protein
MKRVIPILAILILGTAALFAQSGSVDLVQAEYGSGKTWADVTARVRSLGRENSLKIQVDNETLGGDPTPGTPKDLRMRVRDEHGVVSVLHYHEGDLISMALRGGGFGAEGLRVAHAQYGTDSRFVDVTDVLNSHIERGQLSLRVLDDTMGGDPAYGVPKKLVVWYTRDGRELQASVNEGDYLNLPGAGSGAWSQARLQILRADYGADNHYANVTSRVTAGIQDDQLNLRVSNDAMGGDPAENQHKTLSIWYRYNGKMANSVVEEGNDLNLPDNAAAFRGKLRVLRAQYGAGYLYRDVTGRLNAGLQGDTLRLRVTNDSMGGDPAGHQGKQLTVLYLYDGQQYQVSANENEELSLPARGARYADQTTGGFQILLASYGETDDRVDVTRRLNELVQNGQLQIQVSNAMMGRDPSEGHLKRLTVIYLWQGLRYQVSAAEGETISIP